MSQYIYIYCLYVIHLSALYIYHNFASYNNYSKSSGIISSAGIALLPELLSLLPQSDSQDYHNLFSQSSAKMFGHYTTTITYLYFGVF